MKHVERDPAETSRLNDFDERLADDQLGMGGFYQKGAGTHGGELRGPEQSPGGRRQSRVE